jgi:hypothetical protein
MRDHEIADTTITTTRTTAAAAMTMAGYSSAARFAGLFKFESLVKFPNKLTDFAVTRTEKLPL